MSQLAIATEGCCKGHECDNCAMCRKGHCCRRDNPRYRLPKEGEWEGFIYGEIGVLNEDGYMLECHVCGGWYKKLGVHAFQAHDLLVVEYKAIFGIPSTRALVSESEAAHLRIVHADQMAYMNENHAAGLYPNPAIKASTEQRSAWIKGKKHRAGVLKARRTHPIKGRRQKSVTDLASLLRTVSVRHASAVPISNVAWELCLTLQDGDSIRLEMPYCAFKLYTTGKEHAE